MLSVAAGVATVVALRSLGLAIGDSLTSNVRASNHGDITIRKGDTGPGNLNFGVTGDDEVFTDFQRVLINEWVAANDAVTTEYTSLNLQVRPAEGGTAAGTILNFISAIFIDPETYPPTDDIRALDPKGVPLSELFQGGAEVVISDNMAQTQEIAIGDEIRVSGTDGTFTVRGIACPSAPLPPRRAARSRAQASS